VTSKPQPLLAMRRTFSDFDRLAQAVRGFGLDWLQLDRGPLNATLQQAGLPGTLLSRFHFNRSFHQCGTVPAGTRTFAVIGPRAPHVEWGRGRGTGNHIVLFPRDDEFQFVSQPGFYGDTMSVTEETIRSVAELSCLPDPLAALPEGQAFLEADPHGVALLRQRLTELHAGIGRSRSTATSSDLDLELVSTLIAALPIDHGRSSSPSGPWRRSRALRSAIDYIEDHAGEPPTIADVCRASGASWRTLDYAFRERFGISPKRYLQAKRLWGVRRELAGGDAPRFVSEVAAHWGFWHMGKFAAEYRKQFGELPSETIRRR